MFPHDFMWGAATAAYQIEGGAREDGKGESIWDAFCRVPGAVRNGETGDVACDYYHRWADDVRLMSELGLRAYRFSIGWPRVLPEGVGPVNPAGLDFYDRLTDALLAANIRPFITLYHWDLPQALQDRGGWPSRESVGWFAEYVEAVSRRLGDRVHDWITHNEPWVVAMLGYASGLHAPGQRDPVAAFLAAHHLLLSHGEAVPILRRNSPGARVGITLNLTPIHPASNTEADLAAARRKDGFVNRWFLEALYRGAYPADMLAYYGALWPLPDFPAADLARIAVPTDFLGVNYYTRHVVSHDPRGLEVQTQTVHVEGAEYTHNDWEVYPAGLSELLLRLRGEYAPPAVYLTENGAAFLDAPDANGDVNDPHRITYLRAHLLEAHKAITAGVPLRGYFVWSLMDNFEWAQGYSKRFGIVYVDYPTQRRLVKTGGRWYADVIRANGIKDG